MPEIPEVAEFTVPCDSGRLVTTANGDKLVLQDINLDATTNAALAWLVNQEPGTPLHVEIKLAP